MTPSDPARQQPAPRQHHSDQAGDAFDRFEAAVRRHRDAFAVKALVALVPWLGFWVAALTADHWIDFRQITLTGMRGAVPFTLVMVFLPALAAVAAAPAGVVRYVVTVLVSGVAVWAGVTSIAMDDGQASFSIMMVPVVALPLAGLVAGATAIYHRTRSDPAR